MLGLFTKIHHIVPNKTTTRSRLVQTVNSVIWCVSWSPAMLSPKYSADRKSWKILPLSVPSICCWQPKLDNKRCKHITHPPHPVSASLLPFRKYDLQIIVFSWKAIIILKSWAVTEYEPASNLSAHSQNFCFQVALSPRYAAILNFRTRLKQFHI